MHDLAKRSLDKLTQAWQANVQAGDLEEQVRQLRKRREQLFIDAGALRFAVKILVQDGGPATEDDVSALQRAFIAYEMGADPTEAANSPEASIETGNDPTQEATASAEEGEEAKTSANPEEPRRLLNAVDDATQALGGNFSSGEVREKLSTLYPALLARVHKASITGALARLVEAGRLTRVTPRGRGREALFQKVEGAPPVPHLRRNQIDKQNVGGGAK